MTEEQTETGSFAKYLPLILTALALCVAAYVRIRLLQVPLERDEGEYAYMGGLLLDGAPPYLHAYSMKLPGVSVAYALFMTLFGRNAFGIHLGLLVVNALSVWLVYLLAARLLNRNAALASCASYALLSLSKVVYGPFAHATQFVVLCSVAGFLLMLRPTAKSRLPQLVLAGFCLGLAVTMKQHAALLGLFALLYLAWGGYRSGVRGKELLLQLLALTAGIILPYLLVLAWVGARGDFDKFWFWTVSYASAYAKGLPLEQGLPTLIRALYIIIEPQLPLWILAVAGGIFLASKRERFQNSGFIWGYLFFSFLTICPGLYFRWHYFVLLLPGVSLLIGAAAAGIAEFFAAGAAWQRRLIPSLLVAGAIAYGFYTERDCFFALSPLEMSYSTYRVSAFPSAPEIGAYLKSHTGADDTVAVFGSEPEIYFYSQRKSATGHIYMYGLMEDQPYATEMQREMIRQVEQARPKYCVFNNMPFSWLVTPSSPTLLLTWSDEYLKKNYDQVGVVDVYENGSQAVWDAAAAGYKPRSEFNLVVYKLKS